MAKAKKKETLTPEERLQAVLVPDWEQPYKVPENWCWIHLLDSFEESAVELVKEVVEKSVEINNKPKTKRTVIPEEIKSALSSSNEEEIIRLLIKSAPKAVSVQMIMSISKKKFELMDALRSLEQKQIVIKNSLGEYLLKR